MESTDPDGVFRALADERRRLVVQYLSDDPDGVASCREVADYVAARRSECPEDVLIALRHAALPMLEARGLVRYDPERGAIEYRGDGLVEEVLDAVDGTR